MKTHFSLSNEELRRRTEQEPIQDPKNAGYNDEEDAYITTNPTKFISILKSGLAAFKSPLKEASDEIHTNKLVINDLRKKLETLNLDLAGCFPRTNRSYILSEEQASKIFHAKRVMRAQSKQELIFREQPRPEFDRSESPEGKDILSQKKRIIEGFSRQDITWTDEETKQFLKVLQSVSRSLPKEALLKHLSNKMAELLGKEYTEEQIFEKLQQDYLKIKEKNLKKKEKYGKFIKLSLA